MSSYSHIHTRSWQEMVRTLIAYLPVAGMLIIIASLPFEYSEVRRTGHYLLGVGFVLDYIVNRRWHGWHWTKDKWAFVSLIVLFLLIPLWQLWDTTPPTDYFWHQLNRHCVFLLAGVVGIMGFSDRFRLRYVGYTMLLTGLVLLGANLYLYLQQYSLVPFNILVFNEIRAKGLQSHMVINLFVNTGLIIGFYILRRSSSRVERTLVAITMGLNWFYVLLSVGRAGFLTSLIVVFVFLTGYAWRLGRRYWMPLSIALIALMGVLVWNNKRLMSDELFHNTRIYVWDYAVRQIAHKPWLGYGVSTVSTAFVDEMYDDEVAYNGFVVPLLQSADFAACGRSLMTHHAHNTLLMLWLEFGIAGVLALLLFFISSALMPPPSMRIYVWLFLMALAIQMVFEPLGDHLQPEFIGLLLFCFQRACLRESAATPCCTGDTDASK